MNNATAQWSNWTALWIEPARNNDPWPPSQNSAEETAEIESDVERWDGLS